MAKTSVLERLLRRALLIVLVGLACAAVYLWFFHTTVDPHAFDKIYQASVTRASADLRVESALGVPINTNRGAAQHKFFRQDGHRHVRFRFPLQGTRRGALIVGEAVLLGDNWLVVRLVATFPGRALQINLTPGIFT